MNVMRMFDWLFDDRSCSERRLDAMGDAEVTLVIQYGDDESVSVPMGTDPSAVIKAFSGWWEADDNLVRLVVFWGDRIVWSQGRFRDGAFETGLIDECPA